MAITNVNDILAALPGQVIFWDARPISTGVTSTWLVTGQPQNSSNPPVSPGEVPTKNTQGALPFTNAAAGNSLYLYRFTGFRHDTGTVSAGSFTLYDRLYHMSGLSGTITSVQTVNDGTVPLTRYTSGEGVEAWLEIYASSGAGTARTATVTYTNQDGTSGRTGTCVMESNVVRNMRQVVLASGDTGVRSVESVQLDGSTGTVTDFGVTLVYKLAFLETAPGIGGSSRDLVELGLPVIQNNACLSFINFANTASTSRRGTVELLEASS